MTRTTLLITGFEPFDGMVTNPSWEAAQAVARVFHADAGAPGTEAHARLLPVTFEEAPRALAEAIEEARPDAVLCLGVAVGRSRLCVERVAINCVDARIPDNSGHQPIDEPIDADDAPAYFTTLPMRAILAAWDRANIPGRVSNSAGTYVCNRVMFEALRLAPGHGVRAAGFIHVPLTPGLWRDAKQPTVPQEVIDGGCVAAARAVVESLPIG